MPEPYEMLFANPATGEDTNEPIDIWYIFIIMIMTMIAGGTVLILMWRNPVRKK